MNKMKEGDIFLRHHQIGLRIIGAWPKLLPLPGFYFGIGLTLFFFIFEIWNIGAVYGNLEELMDNLVSTIGVLSGLFKTIIFRLKRRSFMLVILNILEDWKTEVSNSDRSFMSQNWVRAQLMSKLIIILYNSMNFTYFLRTAVSYIFDSVQDRKFLAQVSFPIDVRKSPIYEILFIAQFATASFCFNSHALMEGLLATTVLHATSKVEIVRQDIVRFSSICQTNLGNEKLIIKSLRKLVQKHLKFIEFFENVEDIFSYISFIHIFLLTFLQVVSGYMVIDGLQKGEKAINLIHYAILTTSFLVSSGYYCIIGEYLTAQSEIIFNELYSCHWYKFRGSEKKTLNLMLVKARKPVNLTVGKFGNLSLIYLTSIMRTSFSYLSLVRAIR